MCVHDNNDILFGLGWRPCTGTLFLKRKKWRQKVCFTFGRRGSEDTSISEDEVVRDSFQRTDFKLVRTAAFSNKAVWDTLMERAIPRFDGEGVKRYVCELAGTREDADWSSRAGKSTWHIKHTTKAVITASDPHCESRSSRTYASTAAAHLQIIPQRRITSSTHGPGALAKQTAATLPGHWRRSHIQSVATFARKNLEICKRVTHMSA